MSQGYLDYMRGNMSDINIPDEAIVRNILANSKRKFEWLDRDKHNIFNGEVAIVCGAPSMKDKIEEIRVLKQRGVMIWSVNGTHDFLVDHGILPDFFAMVDARHINDFCDKPQDDCVYLLASQCHPKIFKKLADYHRILWHCEHRVMPHDELSEIAKKRGFFDYTTIGARKTVGLCSLFLAYTLGFREMYLYGMDSSFTDYQHSYKQPQNENDRIIDVQGFKTTPALAGQVAIYPEVRSKLEAEGVKLHMRSEGLIKAAHEGKL